MLFSISNEMVNEFISGLFVVLALVVAGCTVALILSGMAKRYPFCRLALTLALTPLIFSRFMEDQSNSMLHLYAMIVILMGITIDGINYLLEPKTKPASADEPARDIEAENREVSQPSVIVWDKAE